MHDIRDKARASVARAIKRGTLTRPSNCSECGKRDPRRSDGRSAIHAHHHRGYDHPLDVEWLCAGCHFKHDPRVRGEANGSAKLTLSQVSEIRRRYRIGADRLNPENGARALAREFNVCGKNILRIVRNEQWIGAALGEEE